MTVPKPKFRLGEKVWSVIPIRATFELHTGVVRDLHVVPSVEFPGGECADFPQDSLGRTPLEAFQVLMETTKRADELQQWWDNQHPEALAPADDDHLVPTE